MIEKPLRVHRVGPESYTGPGHRRLTAHPHKLSMLCLNSDDAECCW